MDLSGIAERFWSKTEPEPNSGCLLWTAGVDSFGYGQISIGHRGRMLSHRVAWQLMRGEIPSGLFVLHRCDTPSCVNVNHLFLGTQADNVRDAICKGRAFVNPRRTHCSKGHQFTPVNIFVRNRSDTGKTFRVCLTCHRTSSRENQARKRQRERDARNPQQGEN